ncbi:competence/damage-inducible protein A [Promethearchaeum syntrophicum]|uniref:Competence/damage-inducible protein A n=1 Tax=Promethearchaeum syntrophicum TaxID=2594042 RepID=A0A5B9DH81_9ARCH|nr:molybdopterin-binding protein [Candidatus Prometheoarchaeum syntrophicum]QEE18066.1 competence damage-inducible protein A [Candidatus Prometheoarchaeum syntrophicum]
MDCEIILIGNELLIGKIRDTNGQWMIEQLLHLGIKISRITTIPDDLEIIKTTIQDSIRRIPEYIFTSGGLGPTYDDMTIEGVSMGLNPPCSLEYNDEAFKMIQFTFKQRYPKRFDKITNIEQYLVKNYPNVKKMANLPKGSKPLINQEGAAPGVYIDNSFTNGRSKIICMPGVPAELQSIFSNNIIPELKELKSAEKGVYHERSFIFHNLSESKLGQKIVEIKNKYPEIWIKTHPHKRMINNHLDYAVELHLTSFSNKENISKNMNNLYQILHDSVEEMGGNFIIEEKQFTK